MKKLFIAFAMLLCVTVLNTAYAATCNPGYYLGDDGACVLCNPNNEPYYRPGDDIRYACPVNSTCAITSYTCNSGYNQTSTGACEQLCGAGFTKIQTGTRLSIPLYANKLTSPAINVGYNNQVCYGNLAVGAGSGLNVQYNGNVYHAVDWGVLGLSVITLTTTIWVVPIRGRGITWRTQQDYFVTL